MATSVDEKYRVACCVRHRFTNMCEHIAKMRILRNFQLPHFCGVFSTICGTVVKNKNEPRGSFSRFVGLLGPF